jgi:Fe-S-cluster containining protein
LILEVSGLDVLREPRWLPYIKKMKDFNYRNWRASPGEVLFLVEYTANGCPFWMHSGCDIYPTRPDMCVAFRPMKDKRCAYNPKCIFDYGVHKIIKRGGAGK